MRARVGAGSATISMSASRIFVDTNVLVYVFDDAEAQKQARARACLEHEQDAHELVVSTQVLQELYVALTKGSAPITTPEVAEQAVRAAAGYTVLQVDAGLVLNAIAATRKHQHSFWDALVLQTAAAGRCDVVLSEDLNDGQVVDGVRVRNPFA